MDTGLSKFSASTLKVCAIDYFSPDLVSKAVLPVLINFMLNGSFVCCISCSCVLMLFVFLIFSFIDPFIFPVS